MHYIIMLFMCVPYEYLHKYRFRGTYKIIRVVKAHEDWILICLTQISRKYENDRKTYQSCAVYRMSESRLIKSSLYRNNKYQRTISIPIIIYVYKNHTWTRVYVQCTLKPTQPTLISLCSMCV